jgi:hypothetical protein
VKTWILTVLALAASTSVAVASDPAPIHCAAEGNPDYVLLLERDAKGNLTVTFGNEDWNRYENAWGLKLTQETDDARIYDISPAPGTLQIKKSVLKGHDGEVFVAVDQYEELAQSDIYFCRQGD